MSEKSTKEQFDKETELFEDCSGCPFYFKVMTHIKILQGIISGQQADIEYLSSKLKNIKKEVNNYERY